MDLLDATDVCIVGGGPAGATLARQLAIAGHATCLIDRGGDAPGHIGVSLPPSVLPILEQIGVRHDVEAAGFLRPMGTLVRWGPMIEAVRKPFPAAGFTVDRRRFDNLLRRAAQKSGARIIRGAVATKPERTASGLWRVPFRGDGNGGEISARILVDASGKSSSLSRAGPDRARVRWSSPTLAVSGLWRGVPFDDIEPRVEAGENHWAWGVRLPDGTIVAAVFLDPARLRGRGRHGMESLYRTLLAKSPLLRVCLSGKLVPPLRACDAAASAGAAVMEKDRLTVGEAALSVDPLSSQGVQRAMVGALQAAAVVNTVLRTPEHADLALTFLRERQHEALGRDRAMGATHYRDQAEACPTPFWQRRAPPADKPASAVVGLRRDRPAPTRPLRLSRLAHLTVAGALEDELIKPRPVLVHPAIDRPVAYLAGRPIADVLASLSDGATAGQIGRRWGARLGVAASADMVDWLWGHRILVDADTPG